MKIKDIKKLVWICILTIISFLFNACEDTPDSADDIKITIETDDSDIKNIQVYTVNGWKYVEDGLSVTVESNFSMKFLQEQETEIRYYYFSSLIATTEGTTFTIEDNDADSSSTNVQVWRNNRTYAFEDTPETFDYYKVTFDSDVTSGGTVTYESPYVDITSPSRVDYNETQEWTYDIVTYNSSGDNYFGNWDFSDNETPVLNGYTDIEVYVGGKTYTVTSGALTVSTTSAIEIAELDEQ